MKNHECTAQPKYADSWAKKILLSIMLVALLGIIGAYLWSTATITQAQKVKKMNELREENTYLLAQFDRNNQSIGEIKGGVDGKTCEEQKAAGHPENCPQVF